MTDAPDSTSAGGGKRGNVVRFPERKAAPTLRSSTTFLDATRDAIGKRPAGFAAAVAGMIGKRAAPGGTSFVASRWAAPQPVSVALAWVAAKRRLSEFLAHRRATCTRPDTDPPTTA